MTSSSKNTDQMWPLSASTVACKCGSKKHEGRECHKPQLKCVNCGDPNHRAINKNCQAFREATYAHRKSIQRSNQRTQNKTTLKMNNKAWTKTNILKTNPRTQEPTQTINQAQHKPTQRKQQINLTPTPPSQADDDKRSEVMDGQAEPEQTTDPITAGISGIEEELMEFAQHQSQQPWQNRQTPYPAEMTRTMRKEVNADETKEEKLTYAHPISTNKQATQPHKYQTDSTKTKDKETVDHSTKISKLEEENTNLKKQVELLQAQMEAIFSYRKIETNTMNSAPNTSGEEVVKAVEEVRDSIKSLTSTLNTHHTTQYQNQTKPKMNKITLEEYTPDIQAASQNVVEIPEEIKTVLGLSSTTLHGQATITNKPSNDNNNIVNAIVLQVDNTQTSTSVPNINTSVNKDQHSTTPRIPQINNDKIIFATPIHINTQESNLHIGTTNSEQHPRPVTRGARAAKRNNPPVHVSPDNPVNTIKQKRKQNRRGKNKPPANNPNTE